MKKINDASRPSFRLEVYTYIYVGARGNLRVSFFHYSVCERISNLSFVKGFNDYNYE